MNYHTQKFLQTRSGAQTPSGYPPKTKRVWGRRQRATIDEPCHMYRASGVLKAEAKRTARLIYRGAAGRKLLVLSFAEFENGEAAS